MLEETRRKTGQQTYHAEALKVPIIQGESRARTAEQATATAVTGTVQETTPMTRDSQSQQQLPREGANFPKTTLTKALSRRAEAWVNGYVNTIGRRAIPTIDVFTVQLRQLIDKLVKEGRLDHLVKNIKEGKHKQRSGGKKDAPRDKADTIYMVQSWQRKTKQKVSQKFSHGSGISFPTLTADKRSGGAKLPSRINAAGHDIPMYIDGVDASADIL
ncbi:hypothetical protein Tco_0250632 [Tanacetum coccineum]